MNSQKINQNINETTKELRTEAARILAVAEALEKAKGLMGVSPALATTVRRVGNTMNRLTESQRNQLDSWLKGGQKAVTEICKVLGVTRARIYQRRNELGLNTYRKPDTHAPAAS